MTEQILNPDEIVKRGEEIYEEKLKASLEPSNNGKFVAIEVISGDYFVGDTIIEALEKGRTAYPDKLFHTIKIGFKGIYKMSSCIKSFSYGWLS